MDYKSCEDQVGGETMEQILLSRKETAEMLGVSTATVDRRAREGILPPVKGHKSPRYNLYDVLKLAGTDTSKLSPFERRRLEREIKELKEENNQLKEEREQIRKMLTNTVAEISQTLREV